MSHVLKAMNSPACPFKQMHMASIVAIKIHAIYGVGREKISLTLAKFIRGFSE